MRKIKLSDLDEQIKRNRKKVNKKIAELSASKRKKKSRPRSKGEREALNQISIQK
ncbi:hypothetical protein G3A_13880 [Bacillus sp. 17376]|uniref:Uncharacterized protein n=1 Tax=Mesobacillus boroniphilus JCM 21738 TaxID=1294265 RepID=W4RM76_9BACI|nr:hypothetical protein [Mesobacillus boroniphilus]ESU31991.1 hypothetical protein G3A_13880 [Bacillus sp. 17376]GAE45525.1 hypothetical protein JCM21738_2338 [Mesobacillus boroniphilus JCM 21738]